ncbi:hypothetical protein DM01DRAFT_244768, partial [Hesseltinella vesiculosa]
IKVFDLHISQAHIDPDCSDVPILSMLVNDQMPGPPIEVTQNDRVRINVYNDLPTLSHNSTENDLTIHFHGIRQYQTVHADGVPYITQDPIRPGQTYTHDFRLVNQAGTFFYHAHYGLKEQTVFGAFVVHEAEPLPFDIDDERTIQLSEWWHRSVPDFEDYLMTSRFKLIPEAESVLINGQTLFNDTHPPSDLSGQCHGHSVISVNPDKTYRFRIIGATTFRTLYFAIAGHNMTVIEVDGEATKPYTLTALEVTPGQRFSVLVHTQKNPTHHDYLIATQRAWSDSEVDRHSNGNAILRYTTEKKDKPGSFAKVAASSMDHTSFSWPKDRVGWIWDDLEPIYGADPVVNKAPSRTLVMRAAEKHMGDGSVRWFINDKAFLESGHQNLLANLVSGKRPRPMSMHRYRNLDSLLSQSISNPLDSGYDPALGTYPIAHYEIIDLVLVSTHAPGAPCRSHPWHTHGHSHFEIARGPGDYNETLHGHWRNSLSPLHRDITLVYPWVDPELEAKYKNSGNPIACGWSKIRLVADNSGIWAVHCHNTPHMMMGMGFILEEGQEMI